MISCMGDGPEQNGKGDFLLIDGKTFKVKETYAAQDKDMAPFGYGFHILFYYCFLISNNCFLISTTKIVHEISSFRKQFKLYFHDYKLKIKKLIGHF